MNAEMEIDNIVAKATERMGIVLGQNVITTDEDWHHTLAHWDY